MKKSKKISVLISLVLITLLALGAVSAAEDTAVTDDASVAAIDEVQTVDDAPVTDEINYESNDIIVTDTGDSGDFEDAIDDVVSDSTGLQDDSDNGDEAVVSDASSPKNALKAVTDPDEPLRAPDGTFRDLYNLIDGAAAGSTITLDRNYVYTASTDSNYRSGITINKRITIDGAGYTIDGKDTARLFYLDGGGYLGNYQINLRNLNLINGYAYNRNSYGAVIYAYNRPVLNVDNCNFTSNGGSNALGGVIYVASGTTTILHSQLMNNTANYGGVFYIAGGTFNMHGCAVLNNSAQNGDNGYTNGNGNFDLDENWWGENHGIGYTFLNQRGSYYTYFDYYILTETLTSPITIEVDMVLDSGNTPTYALDPRYAKITHDADTCNTTDGWVPEAFTIEFTTGDDAYINVTVDNQKLALKVFAGENKKNITELRVVVDNVTLPAQPIAYVYSDVDGEYNLTLGTRVIPVTVTDGVGSYQFTDLLVGQYTVIVSRVDDPVYKTTFNTTQFEVKRYATQLVIDTETPQPTYGTDVTITHTLTPTGPTGFITYYVDGSETGTQLAVNEDFVLSGLSAGEHYVIAKYGGDGSYDVSTSNNLTITVVPASLEFTVADVTVNYPNKGTVNVNSNVDGEYGLTVNDVPYTVTVVNGKGSFEVQEVLEVGEYVIAWNIPAGNYTAASGTAVYNVTAPAPEFDITGESSINYGQTNTITHTITEGATGTITYTLNGEDAGTLGLDQSLVLENLDAGHYVVVAAYSGGGNYGPTSDTFEFDVLPIDVSVTVTSPEVYYPNKGKINLTASAPGTYTIKVGEKTYTATVVTPNVAVEVEVEDVFEVGAYDINVTADLGNNYNPVNTGKIGTYTVTKPATDLIMDVADFTYGADASATLTLKQGETALAGKTLTVTIDGTQKTFPTDANGQATVPLSTLKAGDHYIVAVFAGDENYALAINSTKVTVSQATPIIQVYGSEVTYPKNSTVVLLITTANNDPLAGINVNVTVNGVDYAVVTNEGGAATLTIQGLDAGEYPISAVSVATDNYASVAYSGDAKVVVNKVNATVAAENVIVTYPETGKVSIVSTIAGNYIITVGGKDYPVTITAPGVTATVDIDLLDVGVYDIAVRADLGKNYNPVDIASIATYTVNIATITVKAQDVVVPYPGRGTVVIRTDVAGTYTIKVGDKTYTETLSVGENGIDLNDFALGTYDVTVSASIDNYEELDNVKVATYTVEPADVVVYCDNVTATYPDNRVITVFASVDGDYTITINGSNYTAEVRNGKVNVYPHTLINAGTYDVTVSADLGENYNPVSGKIGTYTVAKGGVHINVVPNATTIAYGDEISLSWTDSYDAVLDDEYVTYIVDGQAIEGNVVSGLSVGTHTVAVKYSYDPNYEDDQSSPVTVTVIKATPIIQVYGSEVTYPKNSTVVLLITTANNDPLAGITVNVTVNGVDYAVVTNAAGTATLTIQGLDAGEYPISAVSVATDNYVSVAYSGNEKVVVNKIVPTVTVVGSVVTYPETGEISFTASEPGTYYIHVGEAEIIPVTVTDTEYTLSVPVNVLPVGVYDISVIADLGKNYEPVNTGAIATYTVNYGTITVKAQDVVVPYPGRGTVVISTDVAGTYTIKVGDKTYTQRLSVGENEISINDNYALGTYDVTVSASIDNYEALDNLKVATYTVEPADVVVYCDNITTMYYSRGTITLFASVDGAYVVTIDGFDYNVDVTSGKAYVYPHIITDVGTYDVTVSADLGGNYNPVSGKIGTFTVEKGSIHLTVVPNATTIAYGDEITLSYTEFVDTPLKEEYLTYIVDGQAIEGNVVSGLSVGTHTVAVKYSSDPNIEDDQSSPVSITVSKAVPVIEIGVVNTTYPNPAGVAVTVKNDAGAPLSGVNVKVTVDGVDYALVTDSDGQAIVTIKGLAAGKYPISAVTIADDNYAAVTYSGDDKIVVEKSSDAKVDVKLEGDQIVVSLTGADNVPLDGTVNVAIDGGEEVPVTITNGQGTLDASSLTAGTHTVTATSVADDNYESATVTKEITKGSAPKEAVITVTVDDIVYGKDAVVQVTFKDKEGNPLQDTLTVTIGDITKTVTIGEDGTGSVNVAGLNVGHYSAVVSFAGNDTYQATSKDDGFDVSKAATVIESEDIVVTANATETMVFTLKDSNGNLLAGKSITVSFNGQIYDLTTDSNGQIEMQIKMVNQGTYSITASYDGEANYEAATASFNVVVKPIAVKLTVTDVTYALSDTKYLTATLTAGDQPLANRIVTFSLNGKTYTGRTNAQGVVKIAVSLTAKKTYSVVASYGGDTTYGSAMAIYKLKVTK